MPAATGAHIFKHFVLTVDGTDYANQVRKARLVPDTPIQTYRTLVPDGTVVDVDSAVWTLELAGLQINITGGLADFLRDNAGTEVDVVLQPKSGTAQATATFTVLAVSPEFGGEQGEWAAMELSLPVVGTVTFGTSA